MDEVANQKDALVSEVASLRADLQQVREDRDRLLLQVQDLKAELINCEELVEKSHELEVCFQNQYAFPFPDKSYAFTILDLHVKFIYRKNVYHKVIN